MIEVGKGEYFRPAMVEKIENICNAYDLYIPESHGCIACFQPAKSPLSAQCGFFWFFLKTQSLREVCARCIRKRDKIGVLSTPSLPIPHCSAGPDSSHQACEVIT